MTRRPTVVTHAGHQAICPTGLCMPKHGDCAAGQSLGPCAECPEGGVRGTADVRLHAGASRRVSANVAVSDYLGARLGVPSNRMIYNPVSRAAFAAATEAPGVDGPVVFAGRLVAEKGLDLLLRALTLVPDARLEVVGAGPMLSAYRDLAATLGLSWRVSFLGLKPFAEVSAAYARASAVCVPSAWHEPFGFAAAEAMAMRRPVVVTPSGALAELCADGRGFVTADLEPRSIAASLQMALGDEPERRRRAGSAYAFALDRLTADCAGKAYQTVYEDVVR